VQHGTEGPVQSQSQLTRGMWDVPDPFAGIHGPAWGEGPAERYDRPQFGAAVSWGTGTPGNYRPVEEETFHEKDNYEASARQRTERLLSFEDMLGGSPPVNPG
jgi:hypothetical protein